MNEHACRLVSIQVDRSGQTHALVAEERLHVDDLFAVTVQLEEWRYLYVARVSLRGIRRLFPQEGAAPLQAPGAAIRIPAAAAWLRCQPLEENEKLCLIVAKQRLDAAAGNDDRGEGGQSSGADEKGAENRTGFEQMIEIPVSR